MQVAPTIEATVWQRRNASLTRPNETVRVAEAQSPWRRPVASFNSKLGSASFEPASQASWPR